MKFTAVTALAALASSVAALKGKGSFAVLRFNNKQLTKGRMDPIVSPGKTSVHVHTIMGGSGFSKSATGEDLVKSKCSNAKIKGDNSNYWVPSVYFHDPKTGKFESVDLYYFNAYYFFDNTNDEIKAFPVGLQIVSGDPRNVNMPEAGISMNLDPSKGPINPARFTCPRRDNNYSPPSWPSNSDGSVAGIGDDTNKGEGIGFPDRTCDGKYSPLRADVHFPSCYNPEAGLTAYDKNMAFPTDNDGKLDCPKGWIHVPKLFYEAYWDTQKFQGRWEEGKGKQPFVFANGDVTGYSSHGDFMSGWDEEILQHIIDTCDAGTAGMDKCPGLKHGLNEGECKIDSEIDEEIEGTLDKLPGDNPLRGFEHGGGSGGGSEPVAPSSRPAPSSTHPPSEDKDKASSTEATPSATKKPSYGLPVEPPSHEAPSAAGAPPIAITAAAEPEQDKPVGGKGKGSSTSCKSRTTRTVTRTVTVTQDAPKSPAETEAYQKRRHMHGHARRQRTHRH